MSSYGDWSLYLEEEHEESPRKLSCYEYQSYCLQCLPLDLRLELASSLLSIEKPRKRVFRPFRKAKSKKASSRN